MEIQENKTNGVTHSKNINYEWKKYNKRMEEIIDDAEIESEMEAENEVRSKNSRLLTISIAGIIIIFGVFMRVQQNYNANLEKAHKKSLAEEVVFSPGKIQPANPQIRQTVPEFSTSEEKITPPKISKNTVSLSNKISTKKNNQTVKAFKSSSTKQTHQEANGKHYVQLGAFSIKKNAEKLASKIKSIGFSAIISVRDIKSIQHQVVIGNFVKKNNSKNKQADLNKSGFNSIIKKVEGAYTLDAGTFQDSKSSNSLVNKLLDQGFKAKVKKISTLVKTYTVRVEGLETKKDAQKVRRKLANKGFLNGFTRRS